LGEALVSKDASKEDGEKTGKSKKGLIIGIVVGVVVLAAGVGAGVFLVPKLTGEPATAEASAEHGSGHEEAPKPKAKAKPEAPEKVVSSKFEAVVVDLRDEDGTIHHLKVGLAAELPETCPEEEFKLLQPRGREAAITYLRTLSLAQATDPRKYGRIKKELTNRVLKAIGREDVERLLIVDFVAQ
jgi:flagellar basal body-associated protein FliL